MDQIGMRGSSLCIVTTSAIFIGPRSKDRHASAFKLETTPILEPYSLTKSLGASKPSSCRFLAYLRNYSAIVELTNF